MKFFKDKCPHCKKILLVKHHPSSKAIIIKECPDQHFYKEFHPALETYVEIHQTP